MTVPRIPALDSPSVSPRAAGTPYQREPEVGRAVSQVAGAIGNTAQMLDELGQRERSRAAATVQLKATNDLKRASLDLLDGPNGVYQALGENALPRHESAMEEYRKRQEKIADGITDERTRERWKASVAQPEAMEFQLRAGRHLFQQQKTVSMQHLETYKAQATEDMIAAGIDKDQIGRIAARTQDAWYQYGADFGIPQDVVDADVAAWRSQATTASALSMLKQEKVGAAKDFYDDVKDHILPTDRKTIDEALAPATDREAAMATVADLFAGVPDRYTAEQRATLTRAVFAEKDPGKRRLMAEEISARLNASDQIVKQQDEEDTDRLLGEVEDPAVGIGRVRVDPAYRRISNAARSSLESYAKRLAAPVDKGTTDAGYAMIDAVFDHKPDGSPADDEYLAGIDLGMFRGNVADADYKMLRSQKIAAIGRMQKDAQPPRASGSIVARLRESIAQWKGGDLPKPIIGRLSAEVRRREAEVLAEAKPKRSYLTQEEQDKIMADVMIPVGRNSPLWFDKPDIPLGAVGLLEQEDRANLYAPESALPDDTETIESYLRSLDGQPATSEALNPMDAMIDASLAGAGTNPTPESRAATRANVRAFAQAYYLPEILEPGRELTAEATKILGMYQALRGAGLGDTEAWAELGIPPDLMPGAKTLQQAK